MSNETKRDVFEDALAYAPVGREYDPVNDDEAGDLRSCLSARYDAALPDYLPVIPKAVGEYLKANRKDSLGEIFWKLGCKSAVFLDSNELYIVLNSYTFARAWVLGVWRVEKTGEIVKVEEEK